MAAYANRSVRENREVNMEGKAADTSDRGYDFNDASTVCVKCSVREVRCLSLRSSV